MASKYKERFVKDVVDHCSRGFTLKSFCVIAGITMNTLRKWRKTYPDFDDACSVAENTVSLFYQSIMRDMAKNGNFNAVKEMLKATDRDFSNKIEVQADHTTVYKIDLGEIAQIVEENSEDDNIIEIEDFKKIHSLNEREEEGRHERGPEDSEEVEDMLVDKKYELDI